MFFEGNQSFQWTFASPPPMYRPGERTGSDKVQEDVLPLDPPGPDVKDLNFGGTVGGYRCGY